MADGSTAAQMRDGLLARIAERSAVVAVVGQGYVGLPLAIAFAEAGFQTHGIDLDEAKVRALAARRSPIGDVSDERVAAVSASGLYSASLTYDPVAESDAVLVCVPTPFDTNKTPDLRYVRMAADAIGERLRRGQLVVLQSTTYPGTTEDEVQPRLERGGLKGGRDFFLAFSPERIDPGVPEHTVANTPKVVGGITEDSAVVAGALLGTTGSGVHRVSSARVAEMTKLLENIFRSVNIALVNELAVLAEHMEIDLWEVIEAAATKPFGFMPFRPGPGVGGHCIPIDPYYLSWKAREYDFSTRFIELAADINQAMPRHVLHLVERALDGDKKNVNGARVLVLGVAFKPDVEDPRNSPAERVIELLLQRGALVSYHDPHVPEFRVGGNVFHPAVVRLRSVPLTDDALTGSDAVVILTAHQLVDHHHVATVAPLVVDAVNATRGGPNVVRLGSPSSAPLDAPVIAQERGTG